LAKGARSCRRFGLRVSNHSVSACCTQKPADEIVNSRRGESPLRCVMAKNGIPWKSTFRTPGPASKIAFGAAFGFFPVALNTISGFGHLDPRLVDVARSMGASSFQMFRRVLFPGALPQVLTGLRTGLILTFIAVVAGEMVSSLHGIGYMIAWLGEMMETSRMYAYIVLIVLMATGLNGLLSLLGSRGHGRE